MLNIYLNPFNIYIYIYNILTPPPPFFGHAVLVAKVVHVYTAKNFMISVH
jgi:hypothetical protein